MGWLNVALFFLVVPLPVIALGVLQWRYPGGPRGGAR